MNLEHKDELSGYISLSTSEHWLERNRNLALSSYCIIINFGKTLSLEADLKTYEIPSNSMCFMNPGSYVSSINSSEDSHFIVEFNSAFYCLELHDKEISCNGLLFGALSYLPILKSNTVEVQEQLVLLNVFKKEFAQDDQSKGDMLRLLLKRLIIICVRIGRKQLFNSQEPQAEDTDIIRVFQALVEKHFKQKHKVADYAVLMYKSPKTLSNTFKKLGQASPLQIIQDRIILEAKRQMYYTDKTIKEITYELGFSEPAQFSRLFKNNTGNSPSEFQMLAV